MKRTNGIRYRRSMALVLTMVLTAAGVAVPTNTPEAYGVAKSPELSAKKGTILTGESEKLTIENVKKKKIKKLTVSSSNKNVATVKKSGKTAFVVKSKKAGKATVKAKVVLKNKKKYTLKYTAKVADVLDRSVSGQKTDGTKFKLTLRFFAKTPLIPYVRVSDYYAQISGGNPLKVQVKGEDEYLLTTPGGATATINTKADVLESDEYDMFEHIFPPEEGDIPVNTDYGGAPFLEALPDKEICPSEHFVLSYADYGIDLLGDKDDIWFPIETAANSFVTGYGASMAYSGTKLYHYTDCFQMDKLSDTTYFEEYVSRYPNGKRPTYMADYAYRELMLLFDVQYGNPGRCYFSDTIRDKGLDQALLETDDQTRAVRDLLRSTSLKDYFLGLGILEDMFFDGGHTQLCCLIYRPYEMLCGIEEGRGAYKKDLREMAEKIGYKLVNTPNPYWYEHDAVMKTKGWNEFDYHEVGDTAVYSMNSMAVDAEAWKTYYEKGGDIPSDTYGLFIQYLNKASKNKDIKNFVIDLTTNAGGDSNVLSGMMQIMAGEPSTYIWFTSTNRRVECPFNVDTNLDGKFDEKDKEVKYPFRFAILTTHRSFSSGNLLPFAAKSCGIMVLGEKSGGGSCMISTTPMGDGLPGVYSLSFKFSDKNWTDVEVGVTPDKVLEIKTKEDGSKDYSAFFDIPSLSKYINEFYAG